MEGVDRVARQWEGEEAAKIITHCAVHEMARVAVRIRGFQRHRHKHLLDGVVECRPLFVHTRGPRGPRCGRKPWPKFCVCSTTIPLTGHRRRMLGMTFRRSTA